MPAPTIAIVNSDPVLLAVLDDLLTDDNYTVTTHLIRDEPYHLLREMQPDLILLEVGIRAATDGWPLLNLLQFDPATQRIPVLVSSVDYALLRDKAALLATLGYGVVEFPANVTGLVSAINDLLDSRPQHES